MKGLEKITNSVVKIAKAGLQDKKVKEGYLIYGFGMLVAGALYLSKQNFTADYTSRISNIFLFVNVCHHTFMGINNSYQNL